MIRMKGPTTSSSMTNNIHDSLSSTMTSVLDSAASAAAAACFSSSSPDRVAVFIYLALLFFSCAFMLRGILADKWHVDAHLVHEQQQVREFDDWVSNSSHEGFSFGSIFKPITGTFKGVTNMIKMFGRVIKNIKSLGPRIVFLGVAMKNLKKGIVSENSSVENGIVGGFEWFKRHVKWIERTECYWMYLLDVVSTTVTSLVSAFVFGFFDLCRAFTGTDMGIPWLLTEIGAGISDVCVSLGLDYPDWIKKCYACEGCLPEKQAQHKMKYLTHAYHSNAKTYYQRADCAFEKAVTF